MDSSDINYVAFQDLDEEIISENPTEKEMDFPIVYTKRLDDMHILTKQNLEDLSINDIHKIIVKESKPALLHFTKRHSLVYKKQDSYLNIVKKIKNINIMSRNVDKLRKRKRYSKPQKSKITVEEIYVSCDECSDDQSHIPTIYLNNNASDNSVNNTIYEDSIASKRRSNNLTTNVPEGKGTTYKFKDSHNYNLESSYLIFSFMNSDFKDIYYIDEQNSPTEYIRIRKKIEYDNIIDRTKCKSVIEIDNCCWYKREERVQRLWNKSLCSVNKSRLKFMRQQHPCIQNECDCCCKIKTIQKKNNKSSISNVIKNEPKNDISISSHFHIPTDFEHIYDVSKWNSFLLEKTLSRNKFAGEGFINTSLKYRINILKRGIRIIKKIVYCRYTHIEINYLQKLPTEYYYVDSNGMIQTAITLRTNKELSLFTKTGMFTTTLKICCWYCEILSCTLRHMLPKFEIFLKKEHTCSPLSCTCCCRDKYTFNINWNKRPVDLLTFKVKHTNGLTLKIIDQKESGEKTSDTLKKCTPRPKESKWRRAPAFEAQTEENKIARMTRTPNKPSSTLSSSDLKRSPLSTSLSSEIQEILKDLQLFVQHNGEVTTMVTKPVEELSTLKLKILNLILDKAQEHVKLFNLPNMNDSTKQYVIKDFSTIITILPKTRDVRLSNNGVNKEFVKHIYNNYTNLNAVKAKVYSESFKALQSNCKSIKSIKYVIDAKPKERYDQIEWYKIYGDSIKQTIVEKRKPVFNPLLSVKRIKLAENQQMPNNINITTQTKVNTGDSLNSQPLNIIPMRPIAPRLSTNMTPPSIMPLQIKLPLDNKQTNTISTNDLAIPSTSSMQQTSQNLILIYPCPEMLEKKRNIMLKEMLEKPSTKIVFDRNDVQNNININGGGSLPDSLRESEPSRSLPYCNINVLDSTATEDTECVLGI